MPIVPLIRVPLPSLRTYLSVSAALLSLSIYYAIQVSATSKIMVKNSYTDWTDTWRETLRNTKYTMLQEPFCIWTLVNMAYCCLILIGYRIQRFVFGELRVSEQQHAKDKFWNYLFYKFIFVFGIINVQYMDEMVLWCGWFSVLGFLHLLSQLGKDRFEYFAISPTTPGWNHARLLTLLCAIFCISGIMLFISVCAGFFLGFNVFAFMAAECIQLNLKTLHVILRYVIHLYELRQGEETGASIPWEKRGPVAYYTEIVFELSVLVLEFMHYMHMLLWSNMFLSMASLVTCMQLRCLFHEIQRRVRKHRNYLWVLNHMEQNYPMAEEEELIAHTDNCAICWEKMETARKLPCGHLFHHPCLLSWLEQDTSCPKCRSLLSMQNPATLDAAARSLDNHLIAGGDTQPPVSRPTNHFFHFDGSRYVSWLPSFSVEVTHTHQIAAMQTSQLDAMTRQVHELFPHFPQQTIMEDLRVTRSIELTVDNILDNRVVLPPIYHHNTPTAPASPPRFMEDWDVSPSEGDETPTDVEFSQSSSERERILNKRKEQLMLMARRRYMDQHKIPSSTSQ